jgi:hypothetical protein
MRATIAGICIFLFFTTTLLTLYQVGMTSGFLQGGYLMMSSYYYQVYGDRPTAFVIADKDERSELSTPFLVQDTRSMRFFRSRVGEDAVQAYATDVWVVSGVSQRAFFGYLRGMEIGILVTGAVMAASIILPYYYDSRRI